jgi:hypothetical protein
MMEHPTQPRYHKPQLVSVQALNHCIITNLLMCKLQVLESHDPDAIQHLQFDSRWARTWQRILSAMQLTSRNTAPSLTFFSLLVPEFGVSCCGTVFGQANGHVSIFAPNSPSHRRKGKAVRRRQLSLDNTLTTKRLRLIRCSTRKYVNARRVILEISENKWTNVTVAAVLVHVRRCWGTSMDATCC